MTPAHVNVLPIARTTPLGEFTNAASVTYTVTFEDPIAGLTADKFDLTVYQAAIFLKTNLGFTQLAAGAVPAGFTGAGTLRFRLVGSLLEVYVDGSLRASATDMTLTSGKIGMRVYGGGIMDDFEAF